MGSRFGFDSPLTVEERDLDLQRAWDDDAGGWAPAKPGELLYPCLRALPIGWVQALYFAQEVVSHQ
eukprot:361655-Pyramimonas_sp.AAC.1